MDDGAFDMVHDGFKGRFPPWQATLPRHHSTMRAALCFALLAFAVAFMPVHAQTTAPTTNNDSADELTRTGLWDGRLKGGNYIVKANAIVALSKHEYVADAVARVVEVNVSLNSSMAVRFYFLEPVKLEGGVAGAASSALDRARAIAEQAAARISPTLAEPKAVKNYPTSTHAHTIEFLIKDEERLNSLFESLNRSFHTGQGRIWRE